MATTSELAERTVAVTAPAVAEGTDASDIPPIRRGLRTDLVVTLPGPTVDYVVVFDPVRSKYFRIKRSAYDLLCRGGGCSAEVLTPEDTVRRAEVASRAAALQLLDGCDPVVERPAARRWWSLGFIQIAQWDPSSLLDRCGRVLRLVAGWPGWVGGSATFASGVAAVTQAHRRFHLTAGLWLAVTVAVTFALALHEFGHAAAVVRYGGRVRRVGVALMYLRPICFCDVSAAWEFPRRRERVVVSFAGIFVNLVIAGASWSMLWLPGLAAGVRHFAFVFGVANVGLGVLNLFPFLKLDGYWMLASALDRPNLRAHAIGDTRSLVRRVVLGQDDQRRPRLPLVLFGIPCLVAPVLLVGTVLGGLWTRALRFGVLGEAAWLALVGFGLAQLASPALRSYREVRAEPIRLLGLVPVAARRRREPTRR